MESSNISGQQAAAPGSAAPENASVTEQQSQEQQKPLTLQDVERIAEERATRIAQSLVNKAEYRISQRAQEQIKALELNKSVLGLDDQQVQQSKQKIIMDELTAQPQPSEPPSPQPVSQGQQAGDVVAAFVNDIFEEVGTQVNQNDPEWKELQDVLDKSYNDQKGAIKVARAATKAAETKAARIAANQQNADARVSTGGSGAAGNNTLDPNAPAVDFWKAAYRKQ